MDRLNKNKKPDLLHSAPIEVESVEIVLFRSQNIAKNLRTFDQLEKLLEI